MANYSALKTAIQQVIKTNGNEEITGSLLQQSLLAMVDSLGAGYQYMGVAVLTPTPTVPGTPDHNVFYIASQPGTYGNFGNLTVANGEVAIFKYNGTWSKQVTGAANETTVNELNEKIINADFSLLILAGLDFEQGTIVTGGSNYASTTRVRTIKAYENTGRTIVLPNGYVFNGIFYYSRWDSATDFELQNYIDPPKIRTYTFNASLGSLVRFTIRKADNTTITAEELVNGLNIKSLTPSNQQFQTLNGNVNALGVRVTELEEKGPQMIFVCRNLWDGSTLAGYISSSVTQQGEEIKITASTQAAYIKLAIEPNTDYTVSAESWCTNHYVAITDANGILLENVNTGSASVKTIRGKANAAFLYVQQKFSGVSSVKVQIEKGSVATQYDPGHWVVNPNNIPDLYEKSVLAGRKAAFFGDSICAGLHYGWATPIANQFGVDSDNRGVSGATIHDRLINGVMSSIRITFENYAQDDPAEFYILAGGFNDSVSDFGNMADGYPAAGNFDTENSTQALEDICAFASQHLVGKKIGFVIHYYPSGVSAWDIKANKIIDVLNKWSIPYLDLRKCATFSLTNNERRAIYGRDNKTGVPQYDPTAGYALDEFVIYDGAVYKAKEPIPAPAGAWDATKWTITGDENGNDLMHCNITAYDILGRIIGEWMKTL